MMVVDRLMNEFTKRSWLFVGVIIFLYSLRVKRQILDTVRLNQVEVNVWDGFYALMTDMYLLTYFVFPVMLFLSVGILIREYRHEVLIRILTPQAWIYRTLKLFFVEAAPLFTVLFILSTLMMIGLPYEAGWSDYTKMVTEVNATSVLQSRFSLPWYPLPVQLCLWFLFLTTVHFSLAGIFLLHVKKGWLYTQAIFTFLLGIVGFKLFPEQFSFLSPTTYLSISMTSVSYSNLIVAALILTGIILGQGLLFRQLSTIQRIDWKQWTGSGAYLLYAGLAILHISYNGILNSREGATADEAIVATFIGVGADYFSYLSFMSYVILFFGATYMSQLRMQRELLEISHYKLIRYKSPHRWFRNIFLQETVFFSILTLSLIGLTLLMAFLSNVPFDVHQTHQGYPFTSILGFLFVSTVLQCLVYTLLCFMLSWMIREVYVVPTVIGLLSLFLFPGLQVNWLPIGMNALIVLESTSMWTVFIQLLGALIVLMLGITLLLRRSLHV